MVDDGPQKYEHLTLWLSEVGQYLYNTRIQRYSDRRSCTLRRQPPAVRLNKLFCELETPSK